MSILKKAIAVLNAVDEEQDFLPDNAAYVHALQSKGLLKESPRIIRTLEDLEALDPDTALIAPDGWMRLAGFMQGNPPLANTYLPATAIATGDQVRAAREALEKEHG